MTKKQKIQYLIFNIFLIATYFIIGYFFGYFNNSNDYIWVSVIVFLASLVLCFIGYFRNTSSLLKLEILILLFAVLGEIFLYFFIKYDLFEKFNSIDKIKNIIMQYKGVSALIFIAIQFLQVTVIPIPSTITTMAGGIIFGFWKSFFYSMIGIISGSMFAFFLGRKFGTK
ncbi:MAG: VTT domain-containing protein, partial [Clostridia bacterium]